MRPFDQEICGSGSGHSPARGHPASNDEGEASEEPFDEGSGNPSPKSEGIDSKNSPNAAQPLLVVAKCLTSGGNAPDFDRLKACFEQCSELLPLVFMEVKRVFAVGIRAIGRREERYAVGP